MGSVEKRRVAAWVFVVAICAVVVSAMIMESTDIKKDRQFVGGAPVEFSLQREESNGDLQAIVKGSIYESGSNMTVFGACLDGGGVLQNDTDASFTAWYPNGSVMIAAGTPMIPVYNNTLETGRFRIHITMGTTIGTYFTEMTCTRGDEYALAFGEWQNPEWVAKIGDTLLEVMNISDAVDAVQNTINNLSESVDQFQNATNINFSQVLSSINALNVSSSTSVQDNERAFNELGRLVHSMDLDIWVLDASNPTYEVASGVYNYVAVDMVGNDNVHVVSRDGYILVWDGESWSERNYTGDPGVSWFGVSGIGASNPYAWYVGTNASIPESGEVYITFTPNASLRHGVWSINGAPDSSSLIGSSSDVFTDVELFQQPNLPSGSMYAYILGSNGEIWYTDDTGASWTDVAPGGFSAFSSGRISQVIANEDLGVTEGYRVAFVTDQGELVYYDGTTYTQYSVSNARFYDVALVYENYALVTGTHAGYSKVWLFNGTALSEQYIWNGTSPKGIAAPARNDVWIATADPSTFYHYDGDKWEPASFAYGKYTSVMIGFGNSSLTTDLQDISMVDASSGYAVGDDGLIVVFQNHYDARFDEILAEMQNLTVDFNSSQLALQQSLLELTNITIGMNQSIMLSLENVSESIEFMNASIQVKLDNISSTITIMDQVLNDTYTGVQNILVQLGIIEAKVDVVISLQNQTLQIVNDTAAGVDELVDQNRRPRPWVTQ